MKNLLTFDLEDWHQLAYRRITGELPEPSDNVFRQIDQILPLLEQFSVQATFFVVGILAAKYPQLIRSIAAAGHEIGSHGYEHLPIYQTSRKQFEQDTYRSKSLLEDLTGQPVLGYRAAEFSIREDTLWALEVLTKLGFTYDSSVFPIRHPRYGIPDFQRQTMVYRLPKERQIVEIPLATVEIANRRLPIAGGGYFRLLPVGLIARAIAKLNAKGIPMVAYAHPYEFDPQPLDVFERFRPHTLKQHSRGLIFNAHQNFGRSTVAFKISRLLEQFEFITCGKFVEEFK
jgi:polysaccharide deacetylase family protein (PEP-CTERM system associated)